MKNKFLLGIGIILSALVTGCGDDDTSDVIINQTINNAIDNGNGQNPNDDVIYISGTYVEDLELDANRDYIINGPLIMSSGTTLTIPAGMTLNVLAAGSDVYIAIAQGARIIANGTVDSPIILTSNASSPEAGDWGGLILLGNAPVNSVSGTATATSEIAGLPYGGSNSSDNSGSLRYVRVEYSGGSADGQSENNGFSFYGVGSDTTVEYIQAYEGKDDGIEFFGGTVNASNISVINAQDDSVDWTEGYSGTLTDVYIEHGGTSWDKAIEADGYNTDIGNNSSPVYFSAPTVNNLTIAGLGSTNTIQDASDVGLGSYEAVRLRAGTKGIFTNVLIEGFGEAFDLDGDDADNPTGQGVIDDELQINDVTFTDVTTKLKNDTGEVFTEADFISGDGNGTGTDYATWGAGWTIN